MTVEFPVVPMQTSARHLDLLLNRYPSVVAFPVVDNIESMVFFGCVGREALQQLLAATREELSTVEDEPMIVTKEDELRHSSQELPSLPKPTLPPLCELNRRFPSMCLDSAVLQVDSGALLQTVHLLFEMLKNTCIWVTRRGCLIGVIRRRQLHSSVAALGRSAPAAV